MNVLIDQGLEDSFLKEQLKTESLIEMRNPKLGMKLSFHYDYDHSYFLDCGTNWTDTGLSRRLLKIT
jgi:hypothetical protein